MAAPHATGVAALMAAVRPDASAAELRAMMLQAAARSSLPVGAGYLDALSSVLGALKGSTYRLGQPPLVRILDATVAGRGRNATTTAQVAVLGSTDAIRRYRVALDGRTRLAAEAAGLAVHDPDPRPSRRRSCGSTRWTAAARRSRRRRAGSWPCAPASAVSGAAAASARPARCGSDDRPRVARRARRHGDRRRRAGRRAGRDAHDHDERLDPDGGGHGRPRVLLPAPGAPPAALLDRRRRDRHRHRRRRPRDRRRRPREPRAGARRPAGSRVLADRPQRCLPGHEPRQPRARPRPRADPGSRRRTRSRAGRRSPARRAPTRSRRWRSTSAPGRAACSCPCSSTSRRRSPTPRARSPPPRRCATSSAATPAALGYVDLAYAGELHAVPYEGIACTTTTIRSGAYPARRPLGFVTRGRPRGATARFLRWIRRSRTARRVIATRYVPL